MPIVVSIGTFISTLLGGLFALYLQDRLHLILGFSAGTLIGVAFFERAADYFIDGGNS
jgi:ZIP family zinc transporter